jgi:hypothetical protein
MDDPMSSPAHNLSKANEFVEKVTFLKPLLLDQG